MKFRFLLVNILLLISFNISCTKKIVQGGQDSGGGNTTVSTIDDVEFYYKSTMENLVDILSHFLDTRVIYQFQNGYKRQILYSLSDKILSLDQNIYFDVSGGLKKVIKASKINIKYDAPCSSIDKVHATASIKTFNVGSPICLSFYELKKLPRGSLEKEIASILLHEYAHAMGFDEKDASLIQASLAENYDKIFIYGSKRLDSQNVESDMDSASIIESRFRELRNYIEQMEQYLKPMELDEKSNTYNLKPYRLNFEYLCTRSSVIKLSVESLSKETWNILKRLKNLEKNSTVERKYEDLIKRIESHSEQRNKWIGIEGLCQDLPKGQVYMPVSIKELIEELMAHLKLIRDLIEESELLIQTYE